MPFPNFQTSSTKSPYRDSSIPRLGSRPVIRVHTNILEIRHIGQLICAIAGDDYEERDEEYAPHCWNFRAFQDQLAPFPNDDVNLIVAGDENPELYAAGHVAN